MLEYLLQVGFPRFKYIYIERERERALPRRRPLICARYGQGW
jgi:hypothetical protein